MRKGRSEAKGGHVELALDLCGIIWKILGKLIQTPPSPLIQNYTRVPSCPALHQGTKCGDRAESAGPKERERKGRREALYNLSFLGKQPHILGPWVPWGLPSSPLPQASLELFIWGEGHNPLSTRVGHVQQRLHFGSYSNTQDLTHGHTPCSHPLATCTHPHAEFPLETKTFPVLST